MKPQSKTIAIHERSHSSSNPSQASRSTLPAASRFLSTFVSILVSILVAVLVSSLVTGCGFIGKKVNAYERAVLSKPGMALVENPKEQAGMNHMFNAREGSMGGFGGAGGGCGCN